MRILAIDDEKTALSILTRAIREAVPEAQLDAFSSISAMLEALNDDDRLPDVAFMDIEMPEMTGLALARLLKARAPRVNIVFVTGYSQYALEAMAMRPSGYLMKPVDKDQILAELNNLRNPPGRTTPAKRIRAQCFGDFEIFADGKPIAFQRSKSKEMLAFLIDRRGAGISAAKIAEALWEDGVYDRARQKQFSNILAGLTQALAQANAEMILRKTNNLLAVDPGAFDCDYYMALEGDMPSVNSYAGEYMAAYSWAELTTASLSTHFQA